MRAIVIAACSLSATALGQFTVIPGNGYYSVGGTVLTPDGRVVAGSGRRVNQGSVAFTWSMETGLVEVGLSPGFPDGSRATGLSSDGRTVVGDTGVSASQTAYRWSQATGFQSLGPLSGFLDHTTCVGTSADGSVVVGGARDRNYFASESFVWTASGGMRSLGRFAGMFFNDAVSVSADGVTVVGWSSGPSSQGWRWTEDAGFDPISALPGTDGTSIVTGASRDSHIVLGRAGRETLACMWVGDDITTLGALPASRFIPNAVDDLGSIVVGQSNPFGPGPAIATVWTAETGIMPLADYLTSLGVSLPSGIDIRTCTAMSSDGRTFSGIAGPLGASSNFAYVVTVPAPSSITLLLTCCIASHRRRQHSLRLT